MVKLSSTKKAGSTGTRKKATTTRKAATPKAKAPAPAEAPPPAPPVVDSAMIDVEPAPAGSGDQPGPQEAVVDGATSPEGASASEGKEEGAAGGGDDLPAASDELAAPEAVEAPASSEAAPAADDGEDLFDELFGEGQGEAIQDDQVEASAPAGPQDLDQVAAAPSASSAAPERVRLGVVEGTLFRVPVGVVEALLGQPTLDRIAVVRGHPSSAFLELQKRMRATNGCCAPAIFTAAGEEAPVIFDGVDAIAAAMELGLTHISVVTVEPGDAGAVQSYLAQRRSAAPVETEDDLIIRVHAHYDE